MQKSISHPFAFSQSYRRQNELEEPNNYPVYTETGTITRVNIDKEKFVRISKPLFMTYYFRSKLAIENPVQMCFILANNLEDHFTDNSIKLIDPNKGEYEFIAPANEPIFPIKSDDMMAGFPYRLAYSGIEEFSDFPTNENSNYPEYSFSKLIFSNQLDKKIEGIYIIQSETFQANEEKMIINSNNFNYLYLIPFLPKLQKTEIAVAGRVNFSVEW